MPLGTFISRTFQKTNHQQKSNRYQGFISQKSYSLSIGICRIKKSHVAHYFPKATISHLYLQKNDLSIISKGKKQIKSLSSHFHKSQ